MKDARRETIVQCSGCGTDRKWIGSQCVSNCPCLNDSHPDAVTSDEEFLEQRAVAYSERHHSSLMDTNSTECRPPMNKEFRESTYDAYKSGGMMMLAHARKSQAAEIEKARELLERAKEIITNGETSLSGAMWMKDYYDCVATEELG